MPFAYYERLTRGEQRVYRQSDGIAAIPIPGAADLCPLVAALCEALESADRGRTQAAADRLLAEIAGRLHAPIVPPSRLRVPAASRLLPHRGILQAGVEPFAATAAGRVGV